MTRIQARTVEDFQFRPNDNVPTRVQKLELLRNFVAQLTDEVGTGSTVLIEVLEAIDAIETDFYYRVGAFWIAAPLASETLFLHPLTDDITFLADFEGSVGFLGGSVSADMIFTVYLDPTLSGEIITSGQILGTFTIHTDRTFSFATLNNDAWYAYRGNTLGVKAQGSVQALASAGSFTLYAFLGLLADYLAMEGGSYELAPILLEGPQYDEITHVLAVEGLT